MTIKSLVLWVIFLLSSVSQAEVLVTGMRLEPHFTKDTWIKVGLANGFDTDTLMLNGDGAFNHSFSYLQVDIGWMPQNPTKVELWLWCNDGSQYHPSFLVNQVTSDWEESMGFGDKPTSIPYLNNLTAPYVGRWYQVDITPLCLKWQSGEAPNYGLEMLSSLSYDWMSFSSSDAEAMYRPLLRVEYEVVRMSFPLKDLGTTPYTANISAVFDNSREWGIVEAYDGEVGFLNPYVWAPGVIGYQRFDGLDFDLSLLSGYKDQVRYSTGRQWLFYDNHTGYDYPAPKGTIIYAPADGILAVATKRTTPDGENYWRKKKKCPVVGGKSTLSWDKNHAIYLLTDYGYTIFFLHCDALMRKVSEEIVEKGFARVYRGRPIARVGDFGAEGNNHLHLGVYQGDVRIDPYRYLMWEDRP